MEQSNEMLCNTINVQCNSVNFSSEIDPLGEIGAAEVLDNKPKFNRINDIVFAEPLKNARNEENSSKDLSNKMPKRNTVLRQQARKVIHNVVNYMQKEKDEGVHNVARVQQRAAEATGCSIRTVRNIITEGKKTGMISVFRTPGKKRQKSRPKTGIDNFDKGVIKRCIHNFHVAEKEMPTLKKLHAKLQRDISFQGSVSSLSRIIKDLGFKWRTTENNRKVLIEKHDLRLKRIEYLRNIKRYRDEGRTIVYTDESYVHSSHTKSKSWSDKGQRIVIVHAGSEDGFIPNSLLMFKSGTKSGDYHDDMNFNNYEKWLKTTLIPNLSPNSVIVIDNAPYHNKLRDPAPTSSSKKEDMKSWLSEKRIPFDDHMLKPQLYQLICQNKSAHKNFVIDDILAQHNHIVLRLPPYHPDLNPIEMAWAAVKGYVATKNVDFNVNRTMELVKEKVDSMGKEEWVALCSKVKKIEEDYRSSEPIIDEMTEKFIIFTEDSSDSESESENDSDSDKTSDSDGETLCTSTFQGDKRSFIEGVSAMSTDDSE